MNALNITWCNLFKLQRRSVYSLPWVYNSYNEFIEGNQSPAKEAQVRTKSTKCTYKM